MPLFVATPCLLYNTHRITPLASAFFFAWTTPVSSCCWCNVFEKKNSLWTVMCMFQVNRRGKREGFYCVAGVTPTFMGAGLCGPRRSSTHPLVCSTSGRCSWAPLRTPTPWAVSSTSAVCCTSRITAPVSCLLALLISFCLKRDRRQKHLSQNFFCFL